ncbi:MAG: type II secretion system protein N [Gammaproteobacteria bacterium]|nr:type II secretion system protein N [Gammaproteobacteria bacterium]
MAKRSHLVLVGLITLLVGLLIFFPARVAYQWFGPSALSLTGIDGSVWSGSAREAAASGVYLRDLKWSMRPLALFAGELSYAFEASPDGGFVEGTVGVGMAGTITLTQLNAALSLQALQGSIAAPGVAGNASARFERLVLKDGIPIAVDGVVDVGNLVVPAIHRSSIGGYRAEFFTQEGGVMASVEDTDGLVDIAGSLQLSSDRNYQFIAQIAPKANTPQDVRQQMQFLGSANERGQHTLRLEGKL